MVKIFFDKSIGDAKPLHSINGGPRPVSEEQTYSDSKYFEELKIPYSRNHDLSLDIYYGGEYTVDVHRIFWDFDADENDEKNYHFKTTDMGIQFLRSLGIETFYRLGSRIEWDYVKRGTLPPKDFSKWARICEHIISHYNYGWADGFEYNITYWEIWNEPDLQIKSEIGQPTWGGTEEQFFTLYKTTARHLKSCFPKLQIGGPALSGMSNFAENFLKSLDGAPLDFYSFHRYANNPKSMIEFTSAHHNLLEKYGYGNVPMMLNEYNYVEGFQGEQFTKSVGVIHSQKGGAFVLGSMLALIQSPVYMMNYYGAGMGVFDGIVNQVPMYPLPTYYALLFYSKLYQLGGMVDLECEEENLYIGAAMNCYCLGIAITDFSEHRRKRKVTLELKGLNEDITYHYKYYSLDEYEDYHLESEGELDKSFVFDLSLRSYGMGYLEITKG